MDLPSAGPGNSTSIGSRAPQPLVYVTVVAAFAVAVAGVLAIGVHRFPGGAAPVPVLPAAAPVQAAPLAQLLLQVLVVALASQTFGRLFRKLGQPAVVGEMLAGLALGPSLLGAAFPKAEHSLFPANSLGALALLSQLGVLLFMFAVGMELDLRVVRRHAPAAALISHASIALPFFLGTAAALFVFPTHAPHGIRFVPFALFMGISLSITAFPVLVRILRDRHLSGTSLGMLVIACAAIDDVTAWCGLACVTAIARAGTFLGAATTLGLTTLFVVGILFLRSALAQRGTWAVAPGRGTLVAALAFAVACALATDFIGVHLVFGAFLAGLAIPPSDELRRAYHERIEVFSSHLLLPLFFAFTGLRTQLGLLHSGTDWVAGAGLLAIAVAGKFGGSALAARFTGSSWRNAATIGTLMNTRGLVELIALNVGMDLGILSPSLFAILVVMALLTTFAAGPILTLLGAGSTEVPQQTAA